MGLTCKAAPAAKQAVVGEQSCERTNFKSGQEKGQWEWTQEREDGLEKETENTAEENIACTISEVPWCNGQHSGL